MYFNNFDNRITEISDRFNELHKKQDTCDEELRSLLEDFLADTYHGNLAKSAEEACLVKLEVVPVPSNSASGVSLYGRAMPYQIGYYKMKKDGGVSNARRYAVKNDDAHTDLTAYISAVRNGFEPTDENIPN